MSCIGYCMCMYVIVFPAPYQETERTYDMRHLAFDRWIDDLLIGFDLG